MLQKTRRSKPFVVHGDKLKPYFGDPPVSWLKTGNIEDAADETTSGLEVVQHKVAVSTDDVHDDDCLPDVDAHADVHGSSSTLRRQSPQEITDTGLPHSEVSVQRLRDENTEHQDLSQSNTLSGLPQNSVGGIDVQRKHRVRHKPKYLNSYVCSVMRAKKLIEG